jgi:hypothetical protein
LAHLELEKPYELSATGNWEEAEANRRISHWEPVVYFPELGEHISGVKTLLPDGYAYKGGTARWLLHRELGSDLEPRPSDIDILMYGFPPEENDRIDDPLFSQLAPDDAARGIQMEVVGSLTEHVRKFEFTMNEVVANNYEVIATPQCILDNLHSVIRVSDYERTVNQGPRRSVVARALRFYTQKAMRGEVPTIKGIPDSQLYEPHPESFGYCSQLDRMAREGDFVSLLAFTRVLQRFGHLPPEVRDPLAAAKYFYSHLPEGKHYEFLNLEVDSNREQPSDVSGFLDDLEYH